MEFSSDAQLTNQRLSRQLVFARGSKRGKHRIQSDCEEVSLLTWLEVVIDACDHFSDNSCIVLVC